MSLLLLVLLHLLLEQSNLLEKMFSHFSIEFTNLGRGRVRKVKPRVLIAEWNKLIRSLYFAFSKEMLRVFQCTQGRTLVLGVSRLKQKQILGFSLTPGRTSKGGVFRASARGHVGAGTFLLQRSACGFRYLPPAALSL